MVGYEQECLVLFSGGQDSTTCLFWAMSKFTKVSAIIFDYGQRHSTEVSNAKSICEDHDVKYYVLSLPQLAGLNPNALTNYDIKIECKEGELPSTFVPARNLFFLSYATAIAYREDIKHIVIGVSEADFSGYPDCRDVFIKSMNSTLNLAMDKLFYIHTPLMSLDKSQVWQLSAELGRLDYIRDKTITCYNGCIGDGCGECPACKLRCNGYKKYLQIRNYQQKN